MAVYRRRSVLGSGGSPSPLGGFAALLVRRRGPGHVQDTPGGVGRDGSQDGYDLDDSFLTDGDGEEEEEEEEEGEGASGQEGDGGSGAEEEEAGRHDDACAACGGEEGELLLCEACPRVFHLACCGLARVPAGERGGSFSAACSAPCWTSGVTPLPGFPPTPDCRGLVLRSVRRWRRQPSARGRWRACQGLCGCGAGSSPDGWQRRR